jgi:hypothetical protein
LAPVTAVDPTMRGASQLPDAELTVSAVMFLDTSSNVMV